MNRLFQLRIGYLGMILLSVGHFSLVCHAADVDAGQVFTGANYNSPSDEAQNKCPKVCADEGTVFNGTWSNRDGGEKNSVCGCTDPAPPPSADNPQNPQSPDTGAR